VLHVGQGCPILPRYMAMPAQSELEIPLLRLLEQRGGEAKPRELYGPLAKEFPAITEADLQEVMESNNSLKWENHVQWVRQKLVQKGEIDGSVRGVWRIRDTGRWRISGVPGSVATAATATAALRHATTPIPVLPGDNSSPGEVIEVAHREIHDAVASELLQLVLSRSPQFFERMVVELLVKMGYGGSRRDAGRAIGRSGDGRVDGVINEDRLGLGVIYIQAKRWENPVGSPEVQRFIGAFHTHGAHKGVLITTSTFTREAKQALPRGNPKVVLIEGGELRG
jgi:restriction system protein